MHCRGLRLSDRRDVLIGVNTEPLQLGVGQVVHVVYRASDKVPDDDQSAHDSRTGDDRDEYVRRSAHAATGAAEHEAEHQEHDEV